MLNKSLPSVVKIRIIYIVVHFHVITSLSCISKLISETYFHNYICTIFVESYFLMRGVSQNNSIFPVSRFVIRENLSPHLSYSIISTWSDVMIPRNFTKLNIRSKNIVRLAKQCNFYLTLFYKKILLNTFWNNCK